jgi:hypothetical protein
MLLPLRANWREVKYNNSVGHWPLHVTGSQFALGGQPEMAGSVDARELDKRTGGAQPTGCIGRTGSGLVPGVWAALWAVVVMVMRRGFGRIAADE